MAGFCTCVNVFNIVGVQVGSALLRAFDDKWQWLFVIMAVIGLLVAASLWFFLVPEPEEIGYIANDDIIEEKAQDELRKMIRKSRDLAKPRNADVNNTETGTDALS